MSDPEFSRMVRLDTLGEGERRLDIQAEEVERMMLARRFGLVAIDRLGATLALSRHGEEVRMEGRLAAAVTQACVASGESVPAEIEAPFELRFRPQPEAEAAEEEIELSESELDVVFYAGAEIDVGEAVAETLLLNLDPYPRSPGAEAALKAAGVRDEAEAGPFGALAGLRDKLTK